MFLLTESILMGGCYSTESGELSTDFEQVIGIRYIDKFVYLDFCSGGLASSDCGWVSEL